MSRWDTYLDKKRLDEKVSKKEINTALKNDNILIGCEFEFKLDNPLVGNDSHTGELLRSAQQEAESYNQDVDQYESDMEEYQSETEDLRQKIDRQQERIDELEGAIEDQNDHNDELDTSIEEADSDKDEAESELETHEDDKDVWVEEGNLDDWDAVKRELNTKISNAKVDVYRHTRTREANDVTEEKWQHEIDGLEKDKSNNEDDLSYREERGQYEHVQVPYVSQSTMPDYWEYMTDYMGYSEQNMYTEPGEKCEMPQDWDDGGGELSSDDMESAINDSGILDSAPFKYYEIGSYGSVTQRPGTKEWAIEDDSSLGDSGEGLEVKNPPMELPGFVKDDLPDMFDWINDIGYTDSDCGFHCHMSLKKTDGNELDFLKLIMFTDEDWIYQSFEERATSTYANSVKDKLKRQSTLSKKEISDLFTRKKLLMKLQMSTQHFDAINSIDPMTGHVEFRYMGGTSYHKKEKEVIATIGMYAHNLSVAMDPEFKRKEYYTKLQRVFNKMEMYYREKKIQALRVARQRVVKEGGFLEQPDLKILDVLLKKEDAMYKRLASVYKLDSKTKSALKANKPFMKGVAAEVSKTVSKGLSQFSISNLRDELTSWY
jgi:hypothetical protein